MTGQQSDTQWYIARNGKQHGPLSDVEMRTFVAQGHLKPTDLIWRPGFADWRPAPAVFPFPSPDAAPPPPPRTGPPRATTQQPRPAQGPAPQGTAPKPGPGPGPGGPGAGPSGSGPGMGGPGMQSGPQEHSFEPNRIRLAQGTSGEGSSKGRRVVGILALLVLIGGGAGWYVWQSGGISLPDLNGSGGDGDVPTVSAPSEPTSGAQQAAGAPAGSGNVQALDAKFQQMPMWNVVKREFPEWYNEHLHEVATLTAENKPQEEINKQLAQALVQLRRQHAQDALAASTDKLKVVANAFLDNLKSLSARSVTACYGFISQGETSPVVLELLQSPEQGAAVQAQVAAIFEAIAEGRKSPTTHERAVKQDYEVLVQELSKLGWKEDDLKTFSNPSALAREPPARVCQMVQDWFVAHLAVQDQAAQERLLVETLKPVVSG